MQVIQLNNEEVKEKKKYMTVEFKISFASSHDINMINDNLFNPPNYFIISHTKKWFTHYFKVAVVNQYEFNEGWGDCNRFCLGTINITKIGYEEY